MTCSVYTVRGEGWGHQGSLVQVWRLALMWSSGTMLPANYCTDPVCSEDQQLEAGIHGDGEAALHRGEELLRGRSHRLKGESGRAPRCEEAHLWPQLSTGPSDEASPSGLPRLSQFTAVSPVSKVCLFFASACSATVFHSVFRLTNHLLQREQRIAENGQRKPMLFGHLTYKVFRVTARWELKFSLPHTGPCFCTL